MGAKKKQKAATTAPVARDWTKPSPVNRLDVAYGGHMEDLLPPMNVIPEDFKSHYAHGEARRWTDLQSEWFYKGLKGEFTAKDGVDRGAALAHLAAIQGSWAPKHEHKVAAVSWLMSQWFSDYAEAAK